MNTIFAIFPFLYILSIFIFSGRFVASYKTEDENETTFGETLFLSIFGLDKTLPCDLCGQSVGEEKSIYGKGHTKFDFVSTAIRKRKFVFGDIFNWSTSTCNWFIFICDGFSSTYEWLMMTHRWITGTSAWFIDTDGWLLKSLGSSIYFCCCILAAVTVLLILTKIPKRKFKGKVLQSEEDSLNKDVVPIRQSKRRNIPTSPRHTATLQATRKETTEVQSDPVTVDTKLASKQEHRNNLMRLTEMCINTIKAAFSSGKMSDWDTKKIDKQHGKIRKVLKQSLKRSKQQKPVHVVMKKKKVPQRGEIDISYKDDTKLKKLQHVGLGCLGLKSSDFYGKHLVSSINNVHDIHTQSVFARKGRIMTEVNQTLDQTKQTDANQISNKIIYDIRCHGDDLSGKEAVDSDESYEFIEEPSDFDLSNGLGPPCASSSTICLEGTPPGAADTECLDISGVSVYNSTEGRSVYGGIQKRFYNLVHRLNWPHYRSLYGWVHRLNWPQCRFLYERVHRLNWPRYRQYVEMPWINSFTENSFLDTSSTQDSMELSDLQNSLNLYGEDMTSLYQIATLWAVKTTVDKAKTFFNDNKSQNCSSDFEYSSDESTEV